MSSKKNVKKVNNLDFSNIVNVYITMFAFLLPLVFHNGYYDIVQTKSITFYIFSSVLILAFGIFWLIKIISRDKKQDRTINNMVKPSAIDISFIVFFILLFISSVFSKYGSVTMIGRESRYQGFVTMTLYIITYFIISRNFKNTDKFFIFTTLAAMIVSLVGVLNCFDVDILMMRSGISDNAKHNFISTIGNIDFYSSYICLLLPFVVCGFCQVKTRFSRVYYLVSMIICTLGGVVSSSDSFALGFIGAMLILPLIFKDKYNLKSYLISVLIMLGTMQGFNIIYILLRGKININIDISSVVNVVLSVPVSLAIVIVCAIGLIVLDKCNNIKKFRIAYIVLLILSLVGVLVFVTLANTVFVSKDFGKMDSYIKFNENWGNKRGEIWIYCVEQFKSFPFVQKLIGSGPETLYFISRNAFSRGNLDQAHNEYLQYLITTGIAGLTAYLAVIVSTIYIAVKYLRENTLAVALITSLIAYWIQATVNIAQSLTTPIMYLFIACIGGLYINECRQKNKPTKKAISKKVKR